MMRFTSDELDRIGRKVYERVKAGIDGAEPWDSLSAPRRMRYTDACLLVIGEAMEIEEERQRATELTSGKFTIIHLKPEVAEKIREIAKAEGKSARQVCDELLEEHEQAGFWDQVESARVRAGHTNAGEGRIAVRDPVPASASSLA